MQECRLYRPLPRLHAVVLLWITIAEELSRHDGVYIFVLKYLDFKRDYLRLVFRPAAQKDDLRKWRPKLYSKVPLDYKLAMGRKFCN